MVKTPIRSPELEIDAVLFSRRGGILSRIDAHNPGRIGITRVELVTGQLMSVTNSSWDIFRQKGRVLNTFLLILVGLRQ